MEPRADRSRPSLNKRKKSLNNCTYPQAGSVPTPGGVLRPIGHNHNQPHFPEGFALTDALNSRWRHPDCHVTRCAWPLNQTNQSSSVHLTKIVSSRQVTDHSIITLQVSKPPNGLVNRSLLVATPRADPTRREHLTISA